MGLNISNVYFSWNQQLEALKDWLQDRSDVVQDIVFNTISFIEVSNIMIKNKLFPNFVTKSKMINYTGFFP